MSDQPKSSRRRPLPLWGEITVVLAVKLLLLYAIWALWFDQPMPRQDRAANTARIILNK